MQLSRVLFNQNPKQTGRFIIYTTVVVVVVVLNIRSLTEVELPSPALDRAGISSLNTHKLSRFLVVGFGTITVRNRDRICPPSSWTAVRDQGETRWSKLSFRTGCH